MSNFLEFLIEFLKTLFEPLWNILVSIFNSIISIFNVMNYVEVFEKYSGDFDGLAWFLAILVVILLVAALGGIGFGIYLLIRKYIRVRKTMVSQEELLSELGNLQKEVVNLNKEKQQILSMKVSQIGLKPGESNTIDGEDGEGTQEKQNNGKKEKIF